MATSGNSLKVRVDIPKNRIYCVIAGKITTKDITEFFTDIRFGVADLKPGFDVVTDLTQCNIGHLAVIPTFRKIMHYIASKEVREIVRVVDKKSIVFRQAMNVTAQIQGYKPVYVETLEEADELLDTSSARTGLRFCLLKTDITYESENQSSVGKILDISMSGCAIMTEAELPAIGQKLLLKVALSDRKTDNKMFELSAEVVRLLEGAFAVIFLEFEDANKKQFWDCLVYELKRDV